MAQLRLNLSMIVATIALFSAMLVANELLFLPLEFAPGINWIYLPAGMRLLCPLLFGGAGALGLLIASGLVNYFHFFPQDGVRSFMGAILSSAAPYLVYLAARHRYGLQASLANLTPRRLLLCALGCSVANPLLLHLWFLLHGDQVDLARGFAVMVAGDLAGTLIVVYIAKALVSLVPLVPRS